MSGSLRIEISDCDGLDDAQSVAEAFLPSVIAMTKVTISQVATISMARRKKETP